MAPTWGRGGAGAWTVMQGPNRVISSMHSAGWWGCGWVMGILNLIKFVAYFIIVILHFNKYLDDLKVQI